MINIPSCFKDNHPFKKTQQLNNNLIAIFANNNEIKYLSPHNCEIIGTISHNYFDLNISNLAFSLDSKLIAYCVESSVYIFDIETQKIVQIIDLNTKIISTIQFDLESKYIIIILNNKKILQYRYDYNSPISQIYKTDSLTISSSEFYNSTLAIGMLNGSISILNIYSKAYELHLKHDIFKINSLCFVDSNTLLSGDDGGNIFISKLSESKLLAKIKTGFTKIDQIILMANKNFILVIGGANYISLYDIKNYKLVHNKYLIFKTTIKKIILIYDYTLMVVLSDNTIKKIELPSPKDIDSLILHNSLYEAYELTQKDNTLKESSSYDDLEVLYHEKYTIALEALIQKNTKKATSVLEQFINVESKREEIQLLFKSFENYERFDILFEQRQYTTAYSMSTKYLALQKTPQYKKMEHIWKNDFQKAQKLLVHRYYDDAKIILDKYITINDKRALVKLSLKNNRSLRQLLQIINSDNFTQMYQIIQKDSLFKELSIYKKIQERINITILEIQMARFDCDYELMNHKLSTLENIDFISSIIHQLSQESKIIQTIQTAYQNNNFTLCYEILDKNNFLNNTQLAILLEKHWYKLISKCEHSAIEGSFKDIKITLGDLLLLETRRTKIGELLRLSFLSQIKILINKKLYHNAETIFYSYIDIFGADDSILETIQLFEKNSTLQVAITQNQDTKVPKDNWIYSKIIIDSELDNELLMLPNNTSS